MSRREMYGSGVSIHIIEPGFYRTPMMDKEGIVHRLEAKIKNMPKDFQESLPVDFTSISMSNY